MEVEKLILLIFEGSGFDLFMMIMFSLFFLAIEQNNSFHFLSSIVVLNRFFFLLFPFSLFTYK